MPYFRYRARNARQDTVEGTVQAASAEVASEILLEQDLTILDLQEERVSILQRSMGLFNKVRRRDVVIFSRQLSVIVSATIPLVQGLRILINQIDSPYLKSVISEVADDVEGGAKLSAALRRHPEAFSDFYINVIRAGETSGKLDDVLNYLADQQERDYDLMAKIRGAMIYPAFVIVGLIVVGTLMMVTVVPQFTAILVETNTELPISTKILIGVSGFLVSFWWLVLLIVGGVIAAFQYTIRTEQGRYVWDRIKLHLPIFGDLFRKIALVRITRSMHTLLTGGVSLSRALEVVAAVAGNAVYRRILTETMREVESGNSIATSLMRSSEIPPMVTNMLQLGERTGRIDEILEKLANFYTREVNNMITNLVSLLEPLIMVVMGVAVALLVSAIILPIYSLATNL